MVHQYTTLPNVQKTSDDSLYSTALNVINMTNCLVLDLIWIEICKYQMNNHTYIFFSIQ